MQKKLGKKGVSIFADGGLFFMHDRKDELVNHEMEFPTEFDEKCKCFCSYNKRDFDSFSKSQKEKILTLHHRTIAITT